MTYAFLYLLPTNFGVLLSGARKAEMLVKRKEVIQAIGYLSEASGLQTLLSQGAFTSAALVHISFYQVQGSQTSEQIVVIN